MSTQTGQDQIERIVFLQSRPKLQNLDLLVIGETPREVLDCDLRAKYLRELEARREAILGSIREQGKLTPALEGQIAAAETKAVLEDLYLPFKPKRRTKAMIARERGLGPLAEAILADRSTPPETLAAAYLSGEVPDAKEALACARS